LVFPCYFFFPRKREKEKTRARPLIRELFFEKCSHPFDPDGNCSDGQLWTRICSGVFNFNDPAWDTISEAAKDLIRHLIVVDPNQRYGTEELLRHPWILGSFDMRSGPITPQIDTNLMKFQERAKYVSPRLGGVDAMEIVE